MAGRALPAAMSATRQPAGHLVVGCRLVADPDGHDRDFFEFMLFWTASFQLAHRACECA
jgi:hypothetical protein